jgi:hypothetical protein
MVDDKKKNVTKKEGIAKRIAPPSRSNTLTPKFNETQIQVSIIHCHIPHHQNRLIRRRISISAYL